MHTIHKQLDREAIRLALLTKRMCAEAGLRRVTPLAFVTAIMRFGPNSVLHLLGQREINTDAVRTQLQEKFDALVRTSGPGQGGYFTTRVAASCRPMLRATDQYRQTTRESSIRLLHLLLGALKTEPELLVMFEQAGIPLRILESQLNDRLQPKSDNAPKPAAPPAFAPAGPENSHRPEGDPFQQFCVNLTALAASGRLDPVIGRENEVARMITILSRRRKNNPLLVGPAGAGKTAIVERLAQLIATNQVPRRLAGREIFGVDLAAIVAGTQFRGQFEERFQALLDAARARSNCILFIDEAHMIVGAGSGLGTTMDAGNMLKPALARGEICCIAATTDAEYQRYLRKDKALERRFQVVNVEEPTAQDTVHILRGMRAALEQHHSCRISDEAIEAAVELSGRHISDRFFPDKALDALDEMCARFGSQATPLGREHAARTVAAQIGAPVETVLPAVTPRADWVRTELLRQVVGQEQAVAAVTRAVRRAFSPLRNPNRPLAVLMFGGPSSTGKTHVAQIVAQCLYLTTPVIRINLAEYSEGHSVSRLFGSPPGYLGHGQGNPLTDQIRRHPHAVVLLDNSDKAHPEVLTALMEMLDTGRVTDAEGNVADLRSAFIVLTTVAGCLTPIQCAVGFHVPLESEPAAGAHEQLVDGCRQVFGEEFVNRVDEFVPFLPLGAAELRRVAVLAVAEINVRLVASGRRVRCDDEVLERIAVTSDNARQVRATIRSELEPLICSALSAHRKKTIRVRLRDKHFVTNERTRCHESKHVDEF